MQLSSRILTALAVLILAVAVVAVRAGSTGTVDAATGTIDVLNVGTCFATDDEIFGVADCVDGDANTGDLEGYNVSGRDEVGEVGTVFATYAHDPKTAPDSPRAVLTNSNLIKVSISDTGRDKRTPVLLPVGNASPSLRVLGDNPATTDTTETDFDLGPNQNLLTIREDYDDSIDIDAEFLMEWRRRDAPDSVAVNLDTPGVETGLRIVKVDRGTGTVETDPFKPMDTSEDALISFYGEIRTDNSSPANDTYTDAEDTTVFANLKSHIVLDEDVGSGGVGGVPGEPNEVAPWLTIQVSKAENVQIGLQYIVYHTSEFETLVGGHDEDEYGTDANANAPDFTNAEMKADSELLVEARADGRVGRQGLRLYETGRFTGRYEGYVQLTDENGDEDGWGLDVGPATGPGMSERATIGVESGPVVIAYRDTDGSTRLHEIEVDTVPPNVNIDSPAHESQGQDTSPLFAGAFSDSDSGLRDDSFHLYIDNSDDENEDGNNGDTKVLELPVDSTGGEYGMVQAGTSAVGGVVQSINDYAGWSAPDSLTYAVIDHDDVFLSEPDDGSLLIIGPDNYADGDTTGTFADSERIDIELEAGEDYNHTIDFQAVVADIAGNLGFSDSDNDGPRFINHLGEKLGDRKPGRYNVIGWYARHIFFLDETPPSIYEEQSVTGFFGENDSDVPQADRSGILVAFDKAVDADSISTDTFGVTLDRAGTENVAVIDVDVQGRAVYLMLESELASDAKPFVDIADGEWVSDPAGNRLTGGKQAPFEANDGISPVLTVTLSGGTGSGEGAEGPSGLTNKAITATISADEEISATPSLVVVCSNIAWDSDGDGENDKSLSDVSGQRSGSITGRGSATFTSTEAGEENLYGQSFMCGDDEVEMQRLQSYSRPGLSWEYEWVNLPGDNALSDGKLTVVAFARDRQSFASLKARGDSGTPNSADTYNWGAATAEFRFDTTLENPMPTPAEDDTVTEARPFVLLTYDDAVTVSIDEFSLGGTVQEISSIGNNRFLFWPEALGLGTHDVSVDAVDAAGNEDTFEYSFKVAERKSFNMKLIAGWNAVSFPANPVDNAIGSVFTEDVIDMVAGWDASDPEKPWSIATRMDGDWSTHDEFATLEKVHAQYGYWVHAQGFVTQRVKLIGGINRTDPDITPPDLVAIPTLAGWNFVGVIDQDGDQTEADFGETLMNGTTPIDAGDYLGSNKRAYTWDAVRSEFKILENGDEIAIGEGIWVYYGGGIAP